MISVLFYYLLDLISILLVFSISYVLFFKNRSSLKIIFILTLIFSVITYDCLYGHLVRRINLVQDIRNLEASSVELIILRKDDSGVTKEINDKEEIKHICSILRRSKFLLPRRPENFQEFSLTIYLKNSKDFFFGVDYSTNNGVNLDLFMKEKHICTSRNDRLEYYLNQLKNE